MHLDKHLGGLVTDYGAWTYAILFMIVFCETGLVVTPFLPGDTLLFAVGAIASTGALDPRFAALLLIVAAVMGDNVNYWLGRVVGPRVFHGESSRFFKRQHLQRTHRFYEKHGGKTIVLARFLPIIRTFAPFVAGIGRMDGRRFFAYNVGGAILWVVLFVTVGYFFGNIPIVKQNFALVIMAIIVLSLLPGMVEWARHRHSTSSP